MVDLFLEKALIIAVFIFAMLAKWYTVVASKKEMSIMEKILDTSLTGLGSSLIIYCLSKFSLPIWVFCFAGGFSGIIVSPIAMVVSKEITPFLDIIVEGIEGITKKWFSKKEKS